MQRVPGGHIAALKVLLGDNFQPRFGFEASQNGFLRDSSGDLAIIMIAAISLKAIGINRAPIFFIGKRFKPFFDFHHVIEIYHEFRISNFQFPAQAQSEKRWFV